MKKYLTRINKLRYWHMGSIYVNAPICGRIPLGGMLISCEGYYITDKRIHADINGVRNFLLCEDAK